MKLFKPLFLLIILANPSFAEIFKWVDEKGVTHYSENKPESIAVEEIHIKSYNNVSIVNNDSDLESNSMEQTPKARLKRPKKVIMYSTEWCGVCKKAKKYFKKENIRYTSYDIDKSKSAKARYKKLGAKGVPVIFVGKKRMNGFSVAGFNRLYKK
ncbi:MAG: DUF4124 domain-containing protein [Proteobacteria bacterium]|nr:DUF4124 domain-containing protein [Pseudomonadota bacterium]